MGNCHGMESYFFGSLFCILTLLFFFFFNSGYSDTRQILFNLHLELQCNIFIVILIHGVRSRHYYGTTNRYLFINKKIVLFNFKRKSGISTENNSSNSIYIYKEKGKKLFKKKSYSFICTRLFFNKVALFISSSNTLRLLLEAGVTMGLS